jgi:S1-C subfamily serine protease
MTFIKGVAVLALLAAACQPACSAADDTIESARKICAEYQDSVVWVSVVCKISFTAEGSKSQAINLPEKEKKVEALATVVSTNGLLVTALSAIDPARGISGREVQVAGNKVLLDATAVMTEAHIILPDGTEVPASVVMKDADLDLAFILAKADSKEFKGASFKPVDLQDSAKALISDDVVSLGRADEVLNRQPSVVRGQVMVLVKKPHEFVRVSSVSLGAPSFNTRGKVLGIGVNRFMGNKPSVPVLIPAAEVRAIAEQAANANVAAPAAPAK